MSHDRDARQARACRLAYACGVSAGLRRARADLRAMQERISAELKALRAEVDAARAERATLRAEQGDTSLLRRHFLN